MEYSELEQLEKTVFEIQGSVKELNDRHLLLKGVWNRSIGRKYFGWKGLWYGLILSIILETTMIILLLFK